jgi:hypothetical protein
MFKLIAPGLCSDGMSPRPHVGVLLFSLSRQILGYESFTTLSECDTVHDYPSTLDAVRSSKLKQGPRITIGSLRMVREQRFE